MFVENVLKLWFVLCSPHTRGKLIYQMPSTNFTQTAQLQSRHAHMYRALETFCDGNQCSRKRE